VKDGAERERAADAHRIGTGPSLKVPFLKTSRSEQERRNARAGQGRDQVPAVARAEPYTVRRSGHASWKAAAL
jgi:hypothetical protein